MNNVVALPNTKPLERRETLKEMLERVLKEIEDDPKLNEKAEDAVLLFSVESGVGKIDYKMATNKVTLSDCLWLLEQSKKALLES